MNRTFGETKNCKGCRYRCANPECRKTITVRGGKVSTLRGRPPKKDWRHV